MSTGISRERKNGIKWRGKREKNTNTRSVEGKATEKRREESG